MRPAGRRWILGALVLAAVVVAAAVLEEVSRARSPLVAAEELRDDLSGIRAEVEACVSTRGQLELRFQALERETDRLRRQVDSIEALDPRGVPAEDYEAYLALVDAYNEAIPEWERQAGEIRDFSSRCDSLVRFHNARADSLRRFMLDEGIARESGP